MNKYLRCIFYLVAFLSFLLIGHYLIKVMAVFLVAWLNGYSVGEVWNVVG